MKIGEFIACAFIHLSRDQRCRKLPIQGDNISQTLHVPSLLVVKRVALTLSRFSCFWGFAFCLADAIYADRTVCKYAGDWVVRFSQSMPWNTVTLGLNMCKVYIEAVMP